MVSTWVDFTRSEDGIDIGFRTYHRPMTAIDPDQLELKIYPDPILRQRAEPVEDIDDSIRAVTARMIELMHQHEGIGLAAPQVGLPLRIFIGYVPFEPADPEAKPYPDFGTTEPANATGQPMVFINPRVTEPSRQTTPLEEGCLSLPDIRGEVLRPETVRVQATDQNGEPIDLLATDLLAKVIQHELDHLDGTLILDRMTQMSRLKVRSAVRQLERQG